MALVLRHCFWARSTTVQLALDLARSTNASRYWVEHSPPSKATRADSSFEPTFHSAARRPDVFTTGAYTLADRRRSRTGPRRAAFSAKGTSKNKVSDSRCRQSADEETNSSAPVKSGEV